jgi:WD40 repeat protein
MRLQEESALRSLAVSHSEGPTAGWADSSWAHLRELAKRGTDRELIDRAVSLLGGLDARQLRLFEGASGFAAAFNQRAQVVVSGAGLDSALRIEPDGTATHLPIRGPGPVCWPLAEAPLQLFVQGNRLLLREAESGRMRRELATREGAAPDSNSILALSLDARFAAASVGKAVFAWAVAGGSLLGKQTMSAEVTALAFSSDHRLLAAADAHGETRVFRIPPLLEITRLPAENGSTPVLSLAFGRDPLMEDTPPEGAERWLLATADQGADIVIWGLTRGLPRSFCRGSTWLASALAFHPDGMTLASAGRNEARLWDLASGQSLLRVQDQSSSTSHALAFDPDGTRLVCGGESGRGRATVNLWAIESQRGLHVLRGLASPIRKVWFSPDSKRAAALGDSRRLAVWDLTRDRLLYLFETSVGDLADEAGGCFDPTSAQFALASGSEARLYDLERGRTLYRWPLAPGMANHVQTDHYGRLLLLRREEAEQRGVWRLHELRPGSTPVLLREQTETNWSAFNMALAPGGERFLVWHAPPPESGSNVVIEAHAVADGRLLWREITATADPDLRVAFDPSGRLFGYIRDHSARLCLRRLSDFLKLGETPDAVDGLYDAIAPSGREFAGNGWYFPDLAGMKNGIRFASGHTPLSWVSAFSPDGQLILEGTEDGVALVLDIPNVLRRLADAGIVTSP